MSEPIIDLPDGQRLFRLDQIDEGKLMATNLSDTLIAEMLRRMALGFKTMVVAADNSKVQFLRESVDELAEQG